MFSWPPWTEDTKKTFTRDQITNLWLLLVIFIFFFIRPLWIVHVLYVLFTYFRSFDIYSRELFLSSLGHFFLWIWIKVVAFAIHNNFFLQTKSSLKWKKETSYRIWFEKLWHEDLAWFYRYHILNLLSLWELLLHKTLLNITDLWTTLLTGTLRNA